MKFSIIVAMSKNRAIGSNNQLLWHLPNDLKYFKKITMGKPVVMGRKTFESIGKPLPGRDNFIISRNNNFLSAYNFEGCKQDVKSFTSVSDLLLYLKDKNYNTEIMIIGGGEIYNQFLDRVSKVYLTEVDCEMDAEVYFPELDSSWQLITNNKFVKDEKHQYNYEIKELEKVS